LANLRALAQSLGLSCFIRTSRARALAISTGEQRIYANILLTIGVVMPE